MKTYPLLRNTLLFVLMLYSAAAFAGQPQPTKSPLPGYWNVETNLTTRNYTIVRFYNAQNKLVYEERLPDLCLELSLRTGPCRRATRQLNAVLRQVLQAVPTATSPVNQVAARLRQQHRIQHAYAVR